MPPTAVTEDELRPFDFLDLGCSRGASLVYGRGRFGATRGLGVDLNRTKVAQACSSGLDAAVADATRLNVQDQVRFVQMMDFLEHLPDLETVERVLESAARAATDFLFIFHPSFEGEAYLRSLGLRLYWWRWRTHTAHVRISDYCQMFERLGLHQYKIRYRTPIPDASHRFVLCDDEPPDQHAWDPEVHKAKPDISFEEPLWRAQEIFVSLRPMPGEEWARITAPWKPKAA